MPQAAMTLLCKGAPDDFQFGLALHLGCMSREPVEAQNKRPARRFAGKEVMELAPALRLNF
jgi:hypothetical protein